MICCNPIRCVIWDMGGVLLRTETFQPRIDLAAELGISYANLDTLIFSSESSHLSETGQLSSVAHWQHVTRTLGLPVSSAPEIRKKWFSRDRVDDHLIAYIKNLRKQVKTGLLSNAWEGMREMVNKDYNFLDAFDQVLFSSEAGMRKPDRRIYEQMLSLLEVSPEETVFVDDSEENVLGAQQVGMKAYKFLDTGQTINKLNLLLEK